MGVPTSLVARSASDGSSVPAAPSIRSKRRSKPAGAKMHSTRASVLVWLARACGTLRGAKTHAPGANSRSLIAVGQAW
jgi:hypothetical protein